jgi:DNA-binding transcriptional regulator of glucitol operon
MHRAQQEYCWPFELKLLQALRHAILPSELTDEGRIIAWTTIGRFAFNTARCLARESSAEMLPTTPRSVIY